MSIIRNGGFERGSIDFWEVASDGALEISTLLPKYGTYCGKFTSAGNYQEFILSTDYVAVDPYDIVNLTGWVKSTAARNVQPILFAYDADYSYIGGLYSLSRTMDTTWMLLNSQVVIPYNTAYIRAGYYVEGSAADEVFYIDGYMGSILTASSNKTGSVNTHPYAVENVSGDTVGNRQDMKQFSTYHADLQIGVVNGVNPTLDVIVYEIDYRGVALSVGTFAQAIAVGRERIQLPNALGKGFYIGYVIGGTGPEFYFTVDIS